jgi:nucleolar protein 12
MHPLDSYHPIAIATMAEQIIAARLKEDKKKDKKRKREAPAAAGAKEAKKGFSLVGEKKDAELEDIFGKSVSDWCST